MRRAMIEAYWRWISLVGFDGLRIDTLKHVEHEFWQEFAPAIRQRATAAGNSNFFMFGEAFDGDDELIGSYTRPNEMDSVFYFSQKFRVFRDIFQCEGPTRAIEDLRSDRAMHFNASPQPMGANAPPQQLLVNFFDNHDVPRFMAGIFDADPASCPPGRVTDDATFAQMRARMYAALAYLLTEDGIPCIYYGTEQEFHGANDPSNREVMWTQAHPYDTTGATFQRIARLNRIRRTYSPLRRGDTAMRWSTMHTGAEQDAGMLAFERTDPTGTVLVVINAHSAGRSETSATRTMGGAMATAFAPGTQLVDVIATDNPRTFTVGGDRSVTVDLDPWQAVILVPTNQVQNLMP